MSSAISNQRVNRQKLYFEIWVDPIQAVAARYGVSDVYLARVCRNLNVPCPPRGYWARIRSGQKVKRPPLPKAKPGDPIEWSRGGMPAREPYPAGRSAAGPGRPSKLLFKPGAKHPLISDVQKYYDAAKLTEQGYLRPFKLCMVDVYVTKTTLERALRAANKLFITLENRGHRVALAGFHDHFCRPDIAPARNYWETKWERWRPDRCTVAYFGSLAMGLTIYEVCERTNCRFVDGEWVKTNRPIQPPSGFRFSWEPPIVSRDLPTGKLALRVHLASSRVTWQATWIEDKHKTLSSMADEIVAELERVQPELDALVAEAEREAEERRLKYEAECRERERVEAERRRLQAIKDSKEQLLSIVQSWRMACSIEDFFEKVRLQAEDLPDEERVVFLERLEMARQMFGGTDALAHFRVWKLPDDR